MSSIDRAEALVRLLDLDETFRASRPTDYAHARVVDIEHPTDALPDKFVRALDPLARLEYAYPDIPEPSR